MEADVCRVGVALECDLKHAVVERRPCGLLVDICRKVDPRAERAGFSCGTDRQRSTIAPDVDIISIGVGDISDDTDLIVVLVDIDRRGLAVSHPGQHLFDSAKDTIKGILVVIRVPSHHLR